MSRTVGGAFLLEDEEKEVMRRQMWALAEYCGVEVITYAILSNHFHILLKVPKRRVITDAELVRLYRRIHSTLTAAQELRLERVQQSLNCDGCEGRAWRERQLRQMFSVSVFMKLFKMRFSIWFNRRKERHGTLWSERFKSVLIETGDALRAVAAYIDLNCVRAGLVADPKMYRYCGYGEASAGSKRAQRGLENLYARRWSEMTDDYEGLLLAREPVLSGETSDPTREHLSSLRPKGGALSLSAALRCKVRYFTDGAVFGTRLFVASHIARLFAQNRLVKLRAPCRVAAIRGCDQLHVLTRMRQHVLG